MKLIRGLFLVALVWLCCGAVARADDTTPQPQPTSPPVTLQPAATAQGEASTAVVPPAPVNLPTPAPAAADTPVLDTPPVTPTIPVAAESGQPKVKVIATPDTESTSSPSNPAPPIDTGPLPTTTPTTTTVTAPGNLPGPAVQATVRPTSTGVTGSPATPETAPSVPDTQPSSNPSININAGPTGYAAPSQLSCTGKPTANSLPFMVSPFIGWTEINSFLDHDNPDYRVDGRIVLANGITVDASNGVASEFFPAYWSPQLRQYINYDGHNGYDFGISYQPVLAAAAGTVTYAGWNSSDEAAGYGLMILINHHNGYVTLYGHLSKLEVKQGDAVSAGQEIGISGSTGNSTGPHLHFSVFHNCQVTDPYGWTGNGADPLTAFDGEHAGYLWLPGHDPLVVNPPPDWPTFPLGLKLPASVQQKLRASLTNPARLTPPTGRLLLLSLPLPPHGAALSMSAALARTESAVTQEAEQVALYLTDLQNEGAIQNFQAVPAAGAIWVRGTATAAQLEGLPDVASLSGVRTRDLIAAQAGLAHSVLVQVAPQSVPSLWPVGFRSGLATWRPVAAVVDGHALVGGFSLPGDRVVVTLEQRRTVVGAVATTADPESGGFVVTLHNADGAPVLAKPGDLVQVTSGGRTITLPILSFSLHARTTHIRGTAQPRSTVLLEQVGDTVQRTVISPSAAGSIDLAEKTRLPAGTLAIASIVDEAGDQESSTGVVPGVEADIGAATLRGWTVGHAPQLKVLRAGHIVFERALHPAADGSFQVALQNNHHPLTLQAGDTISLGSRRHQRLFTIPALAVTLSPGSSHVRLSGPSGVPAEVSAQPVDRPPDFFTVRPGRGGTASVAWPTGDVGIGDQATARLVAPGGDIVTQTTQVQGIVAQEGTSRVRGRVRPGTTISIHLYGARGSLLASALASADPVSGTFVARLRSVAGRAVAIAANMRLDVREGVDTVSAVLPPLGLRLGRSDIEVQTMASGPLSLTAADENGSRQSHEIPLQRTRKPVRVPGLWLGAARQLTLTETLSSGLSVARSFPLPRQTVPPARQRASGTYAS